MTPTQSPDVGAMSFEDALSQLESIVSELERGETPLEETIDRFERGIALARRCEDRLNEADRKVAILLREGARVVEVDMETGERLSGPPVQEEPPPRAPQAAPEPARAEPPREARAESPPVAEPPPRGAPRRGEARRSAASPRPPAGPPTEGQMTLGRSFAVKNPEEMDDDDIPF